MHWKFKTAKSSVSQREQRTGLRADPSRLSMKRLVAVLMLFSLPAGPAVADNYTIVVPANTSGKEQLAGKEVRRYAYLTTGKLFEIVKSDALPLRFDNAIVVGSKDAKLIKDNVENSEAKAWLSSVGVEGYVLDSEKKKGRNVIFVAGGSDRGTLYGAYALCEKFGVTFRIDDDIIPDAQFADWGSLKNLIEVHEPIFDTRGIHPFHDFPEGPDLWDVDDYKSVFEQLVKMRMNFLGLHCYGGEPTVWHGKPGDVNPDGTVNTPRDGAYFHAMREAWGYHPAPTRMYNCGSAEIFEIDDYCSEFMQGYTGSEEFLKNTNRSRQEMRKFKRGLPAEKAVEFQNHLNRLYKDVFGYARSLGISTCVGTDPLGGERLAGALKRLDIWGVDYFWFYTGEGLTWSGFSVDSAKNMMNGFLQARNVIRKYNLRITPGTCGWVLGPDKDRTLWDRGLPKDWPISSINRHIGKERIDEGYKHISNDRPKWVIPWYEDDPNMIGPQMYVRRFFRDASLAAQYECSGLLGIHWRTRVLSAQMRANAEFGWDVDNFDPDNWYINWARKSFGPEAMKPIGLIFSKLDSHFPEPSTWGPGSRILSPSVEKWKEDYAFIDKLDKLRKKVRGKGNLERFDYWLKTWKFARALANPANNRQTRIDVMTLLEETISTKGGVGTLINIQNHNGWYTQRDLPREYQGKPRLLVTTKRTHYEPDENFRLKVRIFDKKQPEKVVLLWRKLGSKQDFQKVNMKNIGRHVFESNMTMKDDIEYRVEAESSAGKIVWPAQAPEKNRTVVVVEMESETDE